MSLILFPPLAPSTLEAEPSAFPLTQRRAVNGITSFRLWGNIPEGGGLFTSFDNITDDESASILEAYNASKSGVFALTLPSYFFDAASPRLATQLSAQTEGTRWHFRLNEKPRVVWVSPDIKTVRVNFVALLTG